jgi:dihydropteroate synthase
VPTGNPCLRLGDRRFDLTHRCLLTGILSPTADDQRATSALDRVLGPARRLVADGADILEIAGAGTPGRAGSGAEEVDTVVSLVTALMNRIDVPLSVRSARAEVLAAACAAGAVLAHDSGGFDDPASLPGVVRGGVSVVALDAERAARALAAGVAADRIILDAGLGRGATARQEAALLRETERLAGLGYPLLISACRTTGSGARSRSLTAVAYGVAHGCRIVRVQDVAGTVRVVRLVERILEARAPGGAP